MLFVSQWFNGLLLARSTTQPAGAGGVAFDITKQVDWEAGPDRGHQNIAIRVDGAKHTKGGAGLTSLVFVLSKP